MYCAQPLLFSAKTIDNLMTKSKSTSMKNRIIAALVGGIIIFLWQFLSWSAMGIHKGEMKYHPKQTEIMSTLSANITEDGVYMIPNLAPGSTRADEEKLMEEMKGKPTASVMYIKSYENNMVRSMIRGFLVDVFLVYLLIYIMTRGGTPPFVRVIAASVSTGLFTWLWGPYTAHIWFNYPWDAISGHLIDAIIAWGICGIWLGWYLNRRSVTR
jgi:hypothetical protein